MLAIFILISSSSCGKQEFPDYEDRSGEFQEEVSDGLYRGEFIPLNSHLSQWSRAKTLLWIKGIQFYVRVSFNGGVPRTHYRQYLHKGAECPDLADDTNGDGIVDYIEVQMSSGERLIRLDEKLTSNKETDKFPRTNKNGNFYYSRSVAVYSILEELRRPQRGAMGYLPANEDLDLKNRTIILYGSKQNPLLPVACARIRDIYEIND